MLHIKTITNPIDNPAIFDSKVNEALLEGWTLTRRYIEAGLFIAELEAVYISEAERCCDNCAYCALDSTVDPCVKCSDASHWEEAEE